MRCLQQGYEQSRANRTDGWNLAKYCTAACWWLSARVRIGLAGAPAANYRVAGTNARLEPELRVLDLGQPLGAMTWSVTHVPAQGMAQLRYSALIRFMERVTSLVIVR